MRKDNNNIIKVMKKWRISGENVLEKNFWTPTLGSLIFFLWPLFVPKNIFLNTQNIFLITFDPAPPPQP